MNSKREGLDHVSLSVMPNPFKIIRALKRPDQPFVMINMLSFKQQASGDYAHLIGEDAYQVYADSVEKVQGALGSRLLWSGRVHQNVNADKIPTFDVIALLEYASPKAFLQSNFRGKTKTKARAAGLRGQWLIAATTMAENVLPDFDNEHVVLIVLSGGMNRNPEIGKRWNQLRQSTYQSVGGKTLWYGRCDHHILGTAKPEIEEVLVTCFPNSGAFEEIAQSLQRKEHLQNPWPYLAYTATSLEMMSGLR